MRVTLINTGRNKGFGTQYRLKILDGYRAGECVRDSVSEQPLFDVNPDRLSAWAQNTGYEVVAAQATAS